MARSRSFGWNSPTTSSISIIKRKAVSFSLFFHPFLGSGVILVDQNILRSQRRSFFITKKTNFCVLLTFCESFILFVAAVLKQLNPLVTFWFSLVLIFLVSTQLLQTNKIVGKLVKEVDTSQHCDDVTQWMVLA